MTIEPGGSGAARRSDHRVDLDEGERTIDVRLGGEVVDRDGDRTEAPARPVARDGLPPVGELERHGGPAPDADRGEAACEALDPRSELSGGEPDLTIDEADPLRDVGSRGDLGEELLDRRLILKTGVAVAGGMVPGRANAHRPGLPEWALPKRTLRWSPTACGTALVPQ